MNFGSKSIEVANRGCSVRIPRMAEVTYFSAGLQPATNSSGSADTRKSIAVIWTSSRIDVYTGFGGAFHSAKHVDSTRQLPSHLSWHDYFEPGTDQILKIVSS